MSKRFLQICSSFLVVLVCLGLNVVAQVEPSNLTAMDLFDMEIAGDPQISPDGEKVIYVRQFNDVMTDKRCSNLWIVNFDGSNNRPLTTGNFSDGSPRWSPDGTRIIYIS